MALDHARGSLVAGELAQPLPTDLRERLERYLASTNNCIVPAKAHDVETEIAVLMMAFYSARTTSKTEAAAMMRVYAEVLRDLPLWAIKEGFARVKAGEVEGLSLDFPPAAPRLRAVVSEVMQMLLADRHNINVVLAARVATPEDPLVAEQLRKTIHDGLKRLSAELHAKADVDNAPEQATAQTKRISPTLDELKQIYSSRKIPSFRGEK